MMPLIVCLAVLLMPLIVPGQESVRPRNVVFILADDQRADTIAALGNPAIHTPNLDRLVARGTSLTRAYCMGSTSGAVCAPSRAMLLSGRSLWHLPKKVFNLPDDLPLWPEQLRKLGYRTFGTGKWHNGKRAFARSFTAGGNIFFGGMGSHTQLPVHSFDPSGKYPRKNARPLDAFSSTAFANEAVQFLETVSKSDELPFFLYVSFTAPHDPRTPPLEVRQTYSADRIPLPVNYRSRHPFDNGHLLVRDEKLAPWPRTPRAVREHLADYYAMITQLDSQVGRILTALEASGKSEDTLIVFTSDHGLAVGSHGLMGKQSVYEHSMKVPMILSGPGVPRGKKVDDLAYLFDLPATINGMLGLPALPGDEGLRMRVGAVGSGLEQSQPPREALVLAYRQDQRGLVTADRGKLIHSLGAQRTQLFAPTDTSEISDLLLQSPFPAPSYKALRDDLMAELRKRCDEMDDPWPGRSPKRIGAAVDLPPNPSRLTPSSVYHDLRRGLGNSALRFHSGKGRVAFLGGSITAGNGWRNLVEADIRKRFPKADLSFVNAGIPSTGSVPGAFRISRDIDLASTDLLFVEFAVNDSTNGRSPIEQIRGLEGIVRQAQRSNPQIDIVLMHFADPGKVSTYTQGGRPEVIVNHEMVATHYALPSIDLAREVTERIRAGEFTWKDDFKNLHPSKFGHRLYAKSVAQLLDSAWTKVGLDRPANARVLREALDLYSFSNARLVGPDQAQLRSGFALDAHWKPKDGMGTRPGFVNVPVAVAEQSGATLKFTFSGTAVGIFAISGPDAGSVSVRIDGGEAVRHNLSTRWSKRLHLPWLHLLASDLEPGQHVLELQSLVSSNGGTAVRIANFAVNAPEPPSLLHAAPTPFGPTPSPRQLAWHKLDAYAFVHFNMNTFTDKEWGDGREDPSAFNPTDLDCRQWVQVCKDAGLSGIILTAKHHDGFCLWPTMSTEHCVQRSQWRNGRGDVLRELSDACREGGLKFGVYLSPWDRNHPHYGDSQRYNDVFKSQLQEVLTNYGEIFEVWFDGACGEGPNGKRQVYDWPGFIDTVRRLQPQAVIFSDSGPDIRWVGNERGIAGAPQWNTLRRDAFYPGIPKRNKALNHGQPDGPHWLPAECDVSIRPGWYYHPSQDDKVKSVATLMEIWRKSVGLGTNLLLNLPVDRRGKVHEADVARLKEWRTVRDANYHDDLAAHCRVDANLSRPGSDFAPNNLVDNDPLTYWCPPEGEISAELEVYFGKPRLINRIVLREYLPLGQRVKAFRIKALVNGSWVLATTGQTIGNRRIVATKPLRAVALRISITDATAPPCITTLSAYCAAPTIKITTPSHSFNESTSVTLSSDLPDTKIHYTLDGTEPTLASPLYAAPLLVTTSLTLKARPEINGAIIPLTAEATLKQIKNN